MRVVIVFALLTLASCGADGLPEAPAAKAETTTGIALSGCATVGVVYGPKGTGQPDC